MRLGIIGPTHWQENCKILHLSEKKCLKETKKIASLAKALGFEIVLVPHFGSISHAFALEFKKLGGKVIGIVPKQDSEFGIDYLDQSACTETIDCRSWRNQPESFNENCQAMLCLGYSAGALNEIAFSKWFGLQNKKPKKIFVVKEFVSARLPTEATKSLDVEYAALKQLKAKLKQVNK